MLCFAIESVSILSQSETMPSLLTLALYVFDDVSFIQYDSVPVKAQYFLLSRFIFSDSSEVIYDLFGSSNPAL